MPELNPIATSQVSSSGAVEFKSLYKLEDIESHPAWHEGIEMNTASRLLEYKAPFSYILSSMPSQDTYLFSYTRKDGMVTHAIFMKREKDKGWEYRNCDIHLCKTLHELASKVMHCELNECIPLSPVPRSSAVKA